MYQLSSLTLCVRFSWEKAHQQLHEENENKRMEDQTAELCGTVWVGDPSTED